MAEFYRNPSTAEHPDTKKEEHRDEVEAAINWVLTHTNIPPKENLESMWQEEYQSVINEAKRWAEHPQAFAQHLTFNKSAETGKTALPIFLRGFLMVALGELRAAFSGERGEAEKMSSKRAEKITLQISAGAHEILEHKTEPRLFAQEITRTGIERTSVFFDKIKGMMIADLASAFVKDAGTLDFGLSAVQGIARLESQKPGDQKPKEISPKEVMARYLPLYSEARKGLEDAGSHLVRDLDQKMQSDFNLRWDGTMYR